MTRPVTPPPTKAPSLPSTHGDNKVQSIKDLYEAAFRLKNVITELHTFIDAVQDDSVSRKQIMSKANVMKHSVLPAIDKIHSSIVESSKDLSPISGLKRACERIENTTAKSFVDTSSKKRKTREIQILEAYISPHATQTAAKIVKRKELPRKAKASKSKFRHQITVDVPVPMNGKEYDKFEMCTILENLSASHRAKAIDEMIRLHYVPCKRSTVYGMLKKRSSNKLLLNNDWHGRGRPPLLDLTSMDAIVNKIKKHQGKAYSSKDVGKLIVECRKEMVAEAGYSTVGVPEELSETTRRNYTAEFALRQEVSIVNKTVRKTNNRFTAENSIIAAFNLALLIAATVMLV